MWQMLKTLEHWFRRRDSTLPQEPEEGVRHSSPHPVPRSGDLDVCYDGWLRLHKGATLKLCAQQWTRASGEPQQFCDMRHFRSHEATPTECLGGRGLISPSGSNSPVADRRGSPHWLTDHQPAAGRRGRVRRSWGWARDAAERVRPALREHRTFPNLIPRRRNTGWKG